MSGWLSGGKLRAARTAAIIMLPLLSGACRGAFHLYHDFVWLDYGFKIFLSGTVGIWTNYFAIRMLFRPRQRTTFGRQGLIPARREELTAAIAAAVARELLDPETIRGYIEENDLIGKSSARALTVARGWLARPVNRAKLAEWVGRQCRLHGEEYLDRWLPKIIQALFRILDKKISSETVWPLIDDALRKELEKPESRRAATRVIITLIDENSPAIAGLFNQVINEWIREKEGWGQAALLLGKLIFRVDEVYISGELEKIVSRPDFFNRVLELVDENIPALVRIGKDPEFRQRLSQLIEERKGELEVWLRSKGLESARVRVLEFLDSEEFWQWLDRGISSLINGLETYARSRIDSDEFRAFSSRYLLRAIRRLDVAEIVRTRISNFDLERLERLVRQVSGDNLCGIELFGGILGMLAGSALINPLWAAAIAGLFGLFFLTEQLFSHPWMRKRDQRGYQESAAGESDLTRVDK